MCIISKIEEIQYALMTKEFSKSGYNKFSRNKYHELKDILPAIMNECHKRDLVLLFNFTRDSAYMDVTDKNNVENYYRFTMPMPELKAINSKMNEIQSIGADSTYLKRYLLVNAFLILEDDVADALDPEDDDVSNNNTSIEKESSKPKNPPIINEALIDLDKKGIPITRASVFSKCTQLGMDDNNRSDIMQWIEMNIKEDSK